MSGEVVAKGFVKNVGECYIEPDDDPRYVIAREVKGGARHRLRREHISFRPARIREDTPA